LGTRTRATPRTRTCLRCFARSTRATRGTDPAVFKYIAFMRRRPDLDLDAFRRLYEEEHAPFALSLLKGVRRYVRNYPVDDTARLARDARQRWEPDFDVMTEMWFDDEAAYREAFRDRDA